LNTLVTYAEKDGKQLVSVVLRVNGAGEAYTESTQILQYALDNFYTKKLDSQNTQETFYDIMGLTCIGASSGLQSAAWKQPAASSCSMEVTLPNTAALSDLTYQVSRDKGKCSISYEYNGWPAGTSEGDFRTIYAPVQMLFERKVEVQLPDAEETSVSVSTQTDGWNAVLTQTADVFRSGYLVAAEYIEQNRLPVLISGFVLLIILILLIILLFFRCTAESRIKRRRKQEEKARKKREEEIERMTTAEIEAELRAVMEQERLKREQERLAQTEAEKAAGEVRKT
jgi:uncharacterized membrane protein